MKAKQVITIIVLAIILTSFWSSALTMTTIDKEKNYNAAVLQLEVYLETIEENTTELAKIKSSFESLRGYEQSTFFSYYVTVLMKVSEETYDYDLHMYLDMLVMNSDFDKYLLDTLKGSPIGSVRYLKTYVLAREYEHTGDTDKAIEFYGDCLSYFDASKRYSSLLKIKDQKVYDAAILMLNQGNFAGAYFKFLEIIRYKDSMDRVSSIVNMLGYTPITSEDNLLPVTGLKIDEITPFQITLSWNTSTHASEYEIYYKEHSSNNWERIGIETNTRKTINGLKQSTAYDFKIVAVIGIIRSDETVLLCQKTATITPTPSPTFSPTPTVTPTKTPAPTKIPLKIDSIEDSNPLQSIKVTWSGGVSPYELCCYHYFNENHNSGINRCMDKIISYTGGSVKNRNSGVTSQASTSGRINHLASGQTYWIVVKDSSGSSVWQKYTCPEEKFTDFSATFTNLTLKKWDGGSWRGNGTTLEYLTASHIEKSLSTEAMMNENNTYYGFQAKLSIGGFSTDPIYDFGYTLILPNGDECVEGWGFPQLKKTDTWISFNAVPWLDIIHYYGEIPTGVYKVIMTINEQIVGSKTFTVR